MDDSFVSDFGGMDVDSDFEVTPWPPPWPPPPRRGAHPITCRCAEFTRQGGEEAHEGGRQAQDRGKAQGRGKVEGGEETTG